LQAHETGLVAASRRQRQHGAHDREINRGRRIGASTAWEGDYL